MNTNSYKDSNRVHNHPGSAISGVYYVKAPSSAGVSEIALRATEAI